MPTGDYLIIRLVEVVRPTHSVWVAPFPRPGSWTVKWRKHWKSSFSDLLTAEGMCQDIYSFIIVSEVLVAVRTDYTLLEL